jgi:hypothetical protein
MWDDGFVPGYDGFEPTGDLQMLVNADLQSIAAYGERHPDEYGGCWLQDRHRYGVAFTASTGDHQAALEELVRLPDRLRVVCCGYSLAELRDLQAAIARAELRTDDQGRLVTEGVIGLGVVVRDNLVQVLVLAGHPEVEARLRAAYGARVSVRGGGISEAFDHARSAGSQAGLGVSAG